MQKLRTWSVVVVLFTTFLFVVSCGGSGSSAPSPSSGFARSVVMFGTSLTAGEGGVGMGYVLGKHEAELNIRVINQGYGGHSSKMLLDHLQTARDFRGQVVIIEAVMNDATSVEIRPDLHVELEDTRLFLTEIVRAFQADGAEVYLLTTNPEIHDPTRHPGLEDYYQVTREVAAATGAALVDLYPLWLRYSSGELHELIPDHCHPTNEALETVFYPEIKRVLEG